MLKSTRLALSILLCACGSKGTTGTTTPRPTESAATAAAAVTEAADNPSVQPPAPAPCPKPTPTPARALWNCNDVPNYGGDMNLASAGRTPLVCKMCIDSGKVDLNLVEKSGDDRHSCDVKQGIRHFGTLANDGAASALVVEVPPDHVLCRIPSGFGALVKIKCFGRP